MANTLISYNGADAYYNNDNTSAPFLKTAASNIYLNADCSNMFFNCRNLSNASFGNFINNFKMDFVKNCAEMFAYAFNFNQPINIPENVNNCSYMFYGAIKLNQPININANEADFSYMFASCTALNQNIIIPPNGTNYAYMFYACSGLNQNIIIPTTNNITGMFHTCITLDQNIQIPVGVQILSSVFRGCYNLNQNIQIPVGATACDGMFEECFNFNQNTLIPNSVNTCAFMFDGCKNLNQNIQMPNSAINCAGMFRNCPNLNQNIQIPNGVENCYSMFSETPTLDAFTMYIPASVNDARYMFSQKNNFRAWIYINKSTATRNFVGFVNNRTTGAAGYLMIYCNYATSALLRGTAPNNSITGSAISWSTSGSYYYNASMMIRIYYNYNG